MQQVVTGSGGPLPSFEGWRLLWPCVAMGGVAQLAVDVLLATLRLPVAANVQVEGLLPFAGYATQPSSQGGGHQLLTAMQSA